MARVLKAPWIFRPIVVLVGVGWLVVGGIGLHGYLDSYYQHRGFAPIARLPRAGVARRLTLRFYSPALGRETDYRVVLPPGYDPLRRRYPVFFLLHGSPGRPQVYESIAHLDVRLENLISRHQVRPMILVCPDGRIRGSTFSDSEWANTTAGRYDSYVLDVVHNLDSRFATMPSRQARVIAGFSAGAYGALNIALHHLAAFGSVEVWSGYFKQSRSGVFAHASPAQLAANSPIEYVGGLRSELAADPLRAFLFVGRADRGRDEIAAMTRALNAAGARASYAVYPGGHDWQLWNGHMAQMLMLASRDVSRPLATATRHRRGSHRHVQRARHVLSALPARPNPPRRLRVQAVHGRRRDLDSAQLIGGLILAIVAAALINLGFLLQHRGLGTADGGLAATLRASLRNRSWLAGQFIGWVGFAGQTAAVAIAPLSLVQAFAAGGLALSVPLAAGIFGHRVSRTQLLAVLLIAAALAVLPIAYSTAHDRLQTDRLLVAATIVVLIGSASVATRKSAARAIAAGAFYGVADAAIKAISVNWRFHGPGALVSGWTVLAALATFFGFLAFQAALRADSAVSAISLMNALAALVAVGCGLLAFGESLGRDVSAVLAHVLAIAVVLGCIPALAAAQEEMAGAGRGRGERNLARATPSAAPGSG